MRPLALGAAVIVIAAAVYGINWWQDSHRPGAVDGVKMPVLTGEAKQGQALFEANCAACHGKNLAGTDKGPPLIHNYYVPGHHPDQAFYVAARFGVRAHHWQFGDMPPVPGVNEDDVTRIIAFVRAVQRENGIE